MTEYANTPSVVVVLVPLQGGLLMIRRALPGEGQGRLALPGGYQMLGQTWREAGATEVREETGVAPDPATLKVVAVETTPDRQQNLIFCESPPVSHAGRFNHDHEVSEVLVVHEPVATAFELHTEQVRAFFERHARRPLETPPAASPQNQEGGSRSDSAQNTRLTQP